MTRQTGSPAKGRTAAKAQTKGRPRSKQKNKKGRRTKLTKALQAEIVRLIAEDMMPYTAACRVVGISDSTSSEWMQRGEGTHETREQTPLYAEFAEAIKKAQAEGQQTALTAIRQAMIGGELVHVKQIKKITKTAAGGETVTVTTEEQRTAPAWQAGAWFLERTQPEQFGRTTMARASFKAPEKGKEDPGEPEITEFTLEIGHPAGGDGDRAP